MECKENTKEPSNIKVEIKQEDWHEEGDGIASELMHHIELTSESYLSVQIEEESFSEVNEVDEDPLSISPRLTSEHISQDGSDACCFFPHSDSGGHQQMGEDVTDFQTAIVFADTPSYTCDICQKSFKCKSKLERHFLSHTDVRPHKCAICGKAFRQKGHLGWHMRLHSDNKPYKCDLCDKSFKRKVHLDQHTKLHSDIKPYKCDRCENSFKRKDHLERHILFHSDIKPYRCDTCKYSFKLKTHLDRHSVTVRHKIRQMSRRSP